mgnify:CR=1 FL=1
MATLTLTLDDARATRLATLAAANGYPSAADFAGAKATEIVDREWAAYLDGLVSKANSGGVLTAAEKALVAAKLGLA